MSHTRNTSEKRVDGRRCGEMLGVEDGPTGLSLGLYQQVGVGE